MTQGENTGGRSFCVRAKVGDAHSTSPLGARTQKDRPPVFMWPKNN